MSSIHIDCSFKLPQKTYPIYIIGAGGIVEDAHLPAYQKAGWKVNGIYDKDFSRSSALHQKFNIPIAYSTLHSMIQDAPHDAIFDLAVPASQILEILEQLPEKANIMMQKPMGESLSDAKKIKSLAEKKGFVASVNFQMKYIPSIIAAKNMIDQGLIGDVHDMEIRMNIYHPWELWDFLFNLPRMEMLYHSIHYMDMIKYFLGMPKTLQAKTFQHPKQMQLASTRSVIIFNYDKPIRAFVNTNHGHDYDLTYQDSFVKWEGTKGAIRATLGKNINFPTGEPDHFTYFLHESSSLGWVVQDIPGHWYPDAFIATMADLMCAIENPEAAHETSLQHAYDTMCIVEAAYIADREAGIQIPN